MGDNVDARIVIEKNIKQPVEHDINDNIDVKADVVSSSIDNHTKDDNGNVRHTEVQEFTPNIPINECDGDNIDARIVGEEDIKQPVEHDINDNIDVKADVVSSSIDNHTKDDNDNICDIEVQDSTSNVPINECDGDNIDARIVIEKNIKQPVEHDINDNIDVKADAVSSSIDNHTKDDNDN